MPVVRQQRQQEKRVVNEQKSRAFLSPYTAHAHKALLKHHFGLRFTSDLGSYLGLPLHACNSKAAYKRMCWIKCTPACKVGRPIC